MNDQNREKWTPRGAFEKGALQEIIERVPVPGRTSEESAFLIAAFAFAGKWSEAERLFALRGPHLESADRGRARFALAIQGVRRSRFTKATAWLRENASDPSTKDAPETAQGLAFYFFFLGRLDRAILWGRRALKRALARNDGYIRLLALDLLGHSVAQSRGWSAASALFADAADLARRRGDSALLEAIRISVLLYEAEAGLRPATIVRELEDRLSKLKVQDTYSRGNLILELSRQMTLRGRWAEARAFLDREAPSIYAFENRRQEAMLQLRLAEISFRQGDAAATMHFLRSARRCLNLIADRLFELRVLGLEWKTESVLHGREPSRELSEKIKSLSAARPNKLNAQILGRAGLGADVSAPDDPLHTLLSLRKNDRPRLLQELARQNYLGLWPFEAGLKPGTEAIVVDEDGHVVTVSSRGVNRGEEPWPRQPLQILRRLSGGVAGKAELLRDIWGYDYDPLRHDSMIYAALAALRKWLGPEAAWLETAENGWRLREGLEFRDGQNRGASPERAPSSFTPAPLFGEFNHRQLKALKELGKRGFWDIRGYKKDFAVSTMTAWRDLQTLTAGGYLIRTGRGRATRYLAAGESK